MTLPEYVQALVDGVHAQQRAQAVETLKALLESLK